MGRAQLHLHRKEPELALAVLDAARPVLEARGSDPTSTFFTGTLPGSKRSSSGWRIDEEIIANARTGRGRGKRRR